MSVRKGYEADIPQVYKLIKELAEFENSPEEVETSIDEMIKDGFGKNPAFGFHVAEVNGLIAGMALYYIRYSTWKGKVLYLEDLIINASHRKNGLGTQLMDAIIEEAKLRGCSGVQWQVLNWNEPAIKFYEKYQAEFDNEWINCRISLKK